VKNLVTSRHQFWDTNIHVWFSRTYLTNNSTVKKLNLHFQLWYACLLRPCWVRFPLVILTFGFWIKLKSVSFITNDATFVYIFILLNYAMKMIHIFSHLKFKVVELTRPFLQKPPCFSCQVWHNKTRIILSPENVVGLV